MYCYDEYYFDKYHQGYSFAKMRPYFSVIAKTLTQMFKPQQMLDVGCAKGYLVHAFRQLGVDSYGIDISEHALSSAPEEVQGDLLKINIDHDRLPFESSVFDLITCLDVVEHLANNDQAISEMRRVLKINGALYISVPSKLADSLLGIIAARDLSHINIRSRKSWIETLDRLGFHYVGEFPRAERKEARVLSLQHRWLPRMVAEVGRLPFILNLRYDLIFKKRA
ncbi:MAG: putative S-adenosylmethionine-dependent methyltransferase [Dehalococcoidia bacterium]|nr:putative S-adenosylmethionine-dependent methyltransferase [Chloroflexota bacterium]